MRPNPRAPRKVNRPTGRVAIGERVLVTTFGKWGDIVDIEPDGQLAVMFDDGSVVGQFPDGIQRSRLVRRASVTRY